MSHRRTLLLAAAAASLVVVRVGEAQRSDHRIVVTPYAGFFVPGSKVAQIRSGVGGIDHVVGIRQQNALALGANASYWFSNLTGIEVGGAWAFSDAQPTASFMTEVPGSISGNESAYVLFASAKMMLNILPFSENRALRFGVGPALIAHGGSAYNSDAGGKFTDLTDVGAAMSLCSRLPVTKFLSLRLRAEDFVYSWRLRFQKPTAAGQDVEFAARLQNDFIFSAGLQLVFWR